MSHATIPCTEEVVRIPSGSVMIEGGLGLPRVPRGVVLFAHGSGSNRHSPRNGYVAEALRDAGLATLLIDLLTPEEEQFYESWFDVEVLEQRMLAATRWLRTDERTRALPIGYFGSSTGASAALSAAAEEGASIRAVVSRGGRPDLAPHAWPRVQSPTLFIVGGDDAGIVDLNRDAHDALSCEKQLAIVPGASHLFEEPGALDEVARLSARWFAKHLG